MSVPRPPRLAVTMGDAAGVGPEVIAGCWADERIHRVSRPLVIGHPDVLRRASRLRDDRLYVMEIDTVEALDDLTFSPLMIPCLVVGDDQLLEVATGQVDPRTGEAAYLAVRLAAELALAGEIEGIVTAPINKAALHAAGHVYPGHTELFAELCGAPQFAMMLYLPPGVANQSPAGLGVVHVTLHTALRNVFAQITIDAVIEKCQLANDMMLRLGACAPRIGVAALNPHGGEEGLFGDEEIRILAPAVEQAKRAGID
ncbi:MAG: PdxA family dehydrogenase, partial [Aeoliella sp.]